MQDDTSVFPFVLPWSDAIPSVTNLSGWLDEHGERKEQILLEPSASGHAILVLGPQHKTLWYEVKAK